MNQKERKLQKINNPKSNQPNQPNQQKITHFLHTSTITITPLEKETRIEEEKDQSPVVDPPTAEVETKDIEINLRMVIRGMNINLVTIGGNIEIGRPMSPHEESNTKTKHISRQRSAPSIKR